MSGLEDGNVADQDIAAVLQSDGFVADAGLFGDKGGTIGLLLRVAAVREASTVDQARAGDGEVVEAFAPQQRVAPVVMAVVLVGIPCGVRLGCVVGPALVAGGLTREG